ncbi:MAG TPA: phosphoribosylanthranilate isomerase [Polyangiaceae bacterium]|jgi:phosphoribosylanthranilate isomerase
MARVKVCGVTSIAQAEACAALGVDALGVNLVPSSVRRVDEATAKAIAAAVGTRTLVVAVVADLGVAEARAVVARTGVGCLQLSGDEPPAVVEALLPHAYKAVRIGGEEDVGVAAGMPGEYVLVDAKVRGALGGTGHAFEWGLVRALAKARKLVLAGGLTPDNVAEAVRRVNPWCLDVASGVESAPGVKDLGKVKAFIAAAKGE